MSTYSKRPQIYYSHTSEEAIGNPYVKGNSIFLSVVKKLNSEELDSNQYTASAFLSDEDEEEDEKNTYCLSSVYSTDVILNCSNENYILIMPSEDLEKKGYMWNRGSAIITETQKLPFTAVFTKVNQKVPDLELPFEAFQITLITKGNFRNTLFPKSVEGIIEMKERNNKHHNNIAHVSSKILPTRGISVAEARKRKSRQNNRY